MKKEMNKFGAILIFILFLGNVKCDEITTTPSSILPSTTTTDFWDSAEDYNLFQNSSSNYTCSDKYRYSMPLIEFTKNKSFMSPLVLLLGEILALLILRGILSYYVFQRRLKKIYIFTHPPILDERYFDDPPPYAVTKP
uniref:Uncharacterized protein n=1 Tax=Panagrolaimus sp. ES5 TaxID=591445 RepID=A0AC34GSJ3_9BILA